MTEATLKSQAAMRLLRGVAGELCELALDTARFGETLANDSKISGASETISLLQRFDLFVQNLEAHARLIDHLSTRLEAGSADIAALHDLIGGIPFFRIRERLRAKIDGGATLTMDEDGQDEHWD